MDQSNSEESISNYFTEHLVVVDLKPIFCGFPFWGRAKALAKSFPNHLPLGLVHNLAQYWCSYGLKGGPQNFPLIIFRVASLSKTRLVTH